MEPKQNNWLVWGDITLIPYVEINGQRSISDDILLAFWGKIIEQGLDRRTFGKETGPDEFIRLVKAPYNLPVFPVINGENAPAGVAYLNNVVGNHAFAHFVFAKEVWGKKTTEMGQALLRYWFNFADGQLDVILGNVPAANSRAVRFVERLGFTNLGEVPYLANNGAATVLYCTHENWRE